MTVLSSGHGLKTRGASHYLDEVNEARRVVDRVAEICKELGSPIDIFHENVATSQSTNLSNIVSFHNSKSGGYDISIHFNANAVTSKPMGTEVWGYDDKIKDFGSKLSANIASAGGFKNRGYKVNPKYYFLKNTKKPALIVEVCFVDSKADADLFHANFEKICVAIAETITGKKYIGGSNPTPPASSNGQLFAVCVGAYTRPNADKVLEEVKAKGYTDAYLIAR